MTMTIFMCRPRAGVRAVSKTTIPANALIEVLELVKHFVPLSVVKEWTPAEREAARDWAAKTHICSSGVVVKVPPKPEFLNRFEPARKP